MGILFDYSKMTVPQLKREIESWNSAQSNSDVSKNLTLLQEIFNKKKLDRDSNNREGVLDDESDL